jgi:hypothetical protein
VGSIGQGAKLPHGRVRRPRRFDISAYDIDPPCDAVWRWVEPSTSIAEAATGADPRLPAR